MDTWYYATAGGQRHGPVPGDELRTLAAAGAIGAQTLVWREGEAQWRPLRDFAGELGLAALPPPLPAPAASGQASPRGLPGCAIAVLVGVGAMFLVMVIGVLAAIALPAYQDYTLRAQVAAALAQTQALKVQVAEAVAANGRCPRNGDADFGPPDSYARAGVASVAIGGLEESGRCGLEARIAAPGRPALDGKAIRLEYHPDSGTWDCSSEVADRLLPASCRG